MKKSLEAHEQSILSVFSNAYVFKIPDFQRPYAWGTEQAQELIDDLLGAMPSEHESLEDAPAYFLGSVVLIKGEGPVADVVDGQQRLTTLTLLLAAIRENVGEDFKRKITSRLYEAGDELAGTKARYRLTLRARDEEFFRHYVQREEGFSELIKLKTELSDSELNLRANAQLFRKVLSGISVTRQVELVKFVLQKCFLVVVSTPDQESAVRIFSVLNSRGLDLAPTDILKASIVGAIDGLERNSYNVKWEDAEEDLGRDDFNTLFGHIRTVYRKAKAKESLVKEFQQYVPGLSDSKKFIDEVLLPMSQAFSDVVAASYSAPTHSEMINEHLRCLNRLEYNDWVPPTLAFFVRYRQEPEALLNFVRDMERLAYFLLVTRAGINERIDRFAKVTREIDDDSNLSLERSSLQLTPVEQMGFFTALNGNLYDDLPKARLPVLLRLDSLISGGGASYDYSVVSIEHVLPQSPPAGSQWLSWFSEPAQRAALVHKLGNLALLTRRKNSSARNWDFDKKKKAYFFHKGVSPFALTTEVLSQTDWTVNVLNARQDRLIEILCKHWRLQDRCTADEWLLKQL
ncbi:hypothetical protein D9X30_0580 [Cupriavidus sp. U2]|uniref:DUF262 domain-containing protein n=1 Tax=Cupriavidus sp. U2 TaxID=2920269 RepID=UPI00129DE76C|nr:DUF262 domain-containing protein [Cupriavidus sp. U2]KAI3594348.1 hypothetical protein D9X30_0580 [Cupriavidus sp. U2]